MSSLKINTSILKTSVDKSCFSTFQKLQGKLEEGKPILAELNEQGQQLSGFNLGDSIEDPMNKQNKQFNVIADQVKRVTDKVNIQRHKSMEVSVDIEFKLFGVVIILNTCKLQCVSKIWSAKLTVLK
jgi:hypothetical protein